MEIGRNPKIPNKIPNFFVRRGAVLQTPLSCGLPCVVQAEGQMLEQAEAYPYQTCLPSAVRFGVRRAGACHVRSNPSLMELDRATPGAPTFVDWAGEERRP